MATPTKGGVIRRFAQSVVDRISGTAFHPTLTSQDSASPAMQAAFNPPGSFFPAGTPLTPIAPAGSTTGRQWDFPSYVNLNFGPRSEQGENAIDFSTLRQMSDPAQGGLDLLRLAIETRKDQLSAQRWKIRGADKNDDGGKDARTFEAWLKRPDGVHTFRQWMRTLVEDHLVIDAAALYFSTDGTRPFFEPVDGATLHMLILGKTGRTPQPPLPAYQQIIKGMPVENYSLDEMGYYAYNLRSNHIYGMSRVEQVLATISIALNRQISQLKYFTEGTIPDGFMEVPKEWSLETIVQFTEWFNSEMSGQLGERRKMRFVPADAKYVSTKPEILKDAFDEWLIRIICFCFSLSPQAFVKEMNRATAETAKEAALEEGLEPMKLWFADLMDDVLERAGFPDLRWQWADEEIVDPAAKATVVVQMYGGATGAGNKIITLAEARDFMNFPPATPKQIEELLPPAPVVTAPTNGNGKQAPSNGAAPSNGNGKKGNEGTSAKVATVSRLRAFGYGRDSN